MLSIESFECIKRGLLVGVVKCELLGILLWYFNESPTYIKTSFALSIFILWILVEISLTNVYYYLYSSWDIISTKLLSYSDELLLIFR